MEFYILSQRARQLQGCWDRVATRAAGGGRGQLGVDFRRWANVVRNPSQTAWWAEPGAGNVLGDTGSAQAKGQALARVSGQPRKGLTDRPS